jgi:hypothetical protein
MIEPDEAAENLAMIERTQAEAFEKQKVPPWFFGGVGLCITSLLFFSELEAHPAIRVAGFVVIFIAEGLLIQLLLQVSGVRWRRSTWTRRALAVYSGWLALCLGLGVVCGLAFGWLGWPYPSVLAGLVATTFCVATVRTMERLVLRHSVGRVNL